MNYTEEERKLLRREYEKIRQSCLYQLHLMDRKCAICGAITKTTRSRYCHIHRKYNSAMGSARKSAKEQGILWRNGLNPRYVMLLAKVKKFSRLLKECPKYLLMRKENAPTHNAWKGVKFESEVKKELGRALRG